VRQLTFSRRGGARPGAGRKPKGATAMVSHAARPELAPRFPVLVTWKLVRGLPSLRRPRARDVLWRAFEAAKDRHGARLVHFSIQSNHVHAIVEARDARALSRGMQGLSVRIARGLNRAWNRSGRVLVDRFHSRVLRTPHEVRYALAYVVNNARKHDVSIATLDPFSSAAAFDGWRAAREVRAFARRAPAPPVVTARSWLLTVGWRRHGLVGWSETPGGVAHADVTRRGSGPPAAARRHSSTFVSRSALAAR
jgi:REP element-mobilizing transposase RayT